MTEVNWPLAEGPHSPAGRAVAVDEATQADYLARYFLLALGSGLAERVYWWQLVARGYGLLDPQADGTLRRRPAFHALAALAHHLEGAQSEGLLPSAAGARLVRFRLADGGPAIVGWSLGAPVEVDLPAPVAERVDLASGEERTVMAGGRVAVGRSPSLLRLAE